jgi:hypothetical protein
MKIVLGMRHDQPLPDAVWKTGSTIDVSKILTTHNEIKYMQNRMAGASGQLRQLAEALDAIGMKVTEPESEQGEGDVGPESLG